MRILLKNGQVYTSNGFVKKDIIVENGFVFDFSSSFDPKKIDSIFDLKNRYIIPGFVDVHVHLREPGFFYKETIATGTMAAAHGGYTCVCPMPNLNPPPSNMNNLNMQLDIIKSDAVVKVLPYGTITASQNGQGQLADMDSMAPYVIGFSDDGKGVQTGELMEEAMTKAKALGKHIVAHCEDESLLYNGYIHDGAYAKTHGHLGICSESEWKQVERDIALAKKTGCKYHICHISTKETVSLVRAAKKEGIKVTCETAPHYLVLSQDDLQEHGKFKMNPPLRDKEDRAALIEGISDGTIDMIATDHAPHSKEEKSKGLEGSAFGIVGLECSFSVLYTHLVKTGIITLEKLIEVMSIAPRKVFHLEGGYLDNGQVADIAILDLESTYTINTQNFFSKGTATPFQNEKVQGKVLATIVEGIIVYEDLGGIHERQ